MRNAFAQMRKEIGTSFDNDWDTHPQSFYACCASPIGKRRQCYIHTIIGRSPRSEYLAAYNRVDIALSPFPYGGGTISAEGLWMGVPVIVKRGNHFLSHLGESIAHNSGLSNWIASDEDEYVAKAVEFSSNLHDLAALRSRLRAQVVFSSLFDAERFANHFENALRGMWERWCGHF